MQKQPELLVMEHLQQMLRVYLANTDYDAYVRSDCGNGDKSLLVKCGSFSTLPDCSPLYRTI